MTGRACLSPSDLASYVREALSPESSASFGAHVAICDRCRDRVALLQRIVDAGVSPIDEALADAARQADAILREPEHRWALLVREEQYRSIGVARRLLAFALDERRRNSRRAIAASTAVSILADLLPGRDLETADLRFDAWKYHSALLREGGRFAEAETALRCAQDAAAASSDPETARASVLLARALLYAEPDIWEPEAGLAVLDEAEPIFAKRDTERFRRARTVRAMILLRMGDAARAHPIFEEVLAVTPPSDEAAWADAAANAARANVDIGDLARADELMNRAEEIHRRRGAEVDLAHDLITRAQLHGRTNQYGRMFDDASDAMGRYRRVALQLSEVYAGFLALHGLIETGRTSAALALARELARISALLDRQQPKTRRTRTAKAVAFVRDLAAATN